MKKYVLYISLLLLGVFGETQLSNAQGAGYKVTGNIIIGGSAKWDYLSFHKASNRLFVSHDTEVVVIKLDDNKIGGRIGGLKGVHGIGLAGKSGKGFITEGKGNQVTIFDLNDLHIIARLKPTGDDPDAISYDSFSDRIFTSNGKGGNATAIDVKTNEIAGTVKLSDSPEASVSDGKGRVFFNIEKTSEVNVVDSKTLIVTAKWKTSPAEEPVAIAFDKDNNRLFVGGRNQILAVMDAATGKVIANFPIGKGVDAAAYDSDAKMIFCSNKDATINVIEQDSADKYEVVGAITTLPGAKTMALDKANHRIYTSAMIPGEKDEKTFGVLILEKK